MGAGWRVGRIAGVEIRIDQSWALIALLVTYSLYLQFSIDYRELSTGAAVALGIGAALLFFGSVLTHEMAHALMSGASPCLSSGALLTPRSSHAVRPTSS